jgi:hypothetical protein
LKSQQIHAFPLFLEIIDTLESNYQGATKTRYHQGKVMKFRDQNSLKNTRIHQKDSFSVDRQLGDKSLALPLKFAAGQKVEISKQIMTNADSKETRVRSTSLMVSHINNSKIESVASSFLMFPNSHVREKNKPMIGTKMTLQDLIAQEQIGKDIDIGDNSQNDECRFFLYL